MPVQIISPRLNNAKVAKAVTKKQISSIRLITIIGCSLCVLGCLMPTRPVECGRLQDFFQNLVGGRDSSQSNNNNNNNDNSNSNNGNGDSNDSDAAASNEGNDQPMMSAMNPYMRYPSFYDNFGSASFGGYPAMSFPSSPMGAMSGLSPMGSMSASTLGSSFSPMAFGAGPHSFGSGYGSMGASGGLSSSASNPLASFGASGSGNGLSSSALSGMFASSPSLMGAYSPYYGRKRR